MQSLYMEIIGIHIFCLLYPLSAEFLPKSQLGANIQSLFKGTVAWDFFQLFYSSFKPIFAGTRRKRKFCEQEMYRTINAKNNVLQYQLKEEEKNKVWNLVIKVHKIFVHKF